MKLKNILLIMLFPLIPSCIVEDKIVITLADSKNLIPNTANSNNNVNNSDSNSSGSSNSSSLNCPTNYIKVPKNDELNVDEFCVAKYEMKNVEGIAKPIKDQTPWTSITRPNAITACQSLGVGYDLISNLEWQTLARDIASTSSNWSTGIVLNGTLNQGNYNSMNPCNADREYVSTKCSIRANTFIQKRTQTLSNGEVIWDINGNIYEMVKDISTGGQYVTTGNDITNLVDTNPNNDELGLAVDAFALDLSGNNLTRPTLASNAGGLGTLLISSNNIGSPKVVLRGGASYDDGSGIFQTDLGWLNATSGSDSAVGFRCVYKEPNTTHTNELEYQKATYENISAGTFHACAVDKSNNVLSCWGANLNSSDMVYGMLGIGLNTSTTRTTPTAVSGVERYEMVSSGEFISCALTTSNKIRCWGLLVGDGTSNQRYAPTLVSGNEFYKFVTTGEYHGCGITTTNKVFCWGDNWAGKLGRSDITGSVPAEIDAGTKYTQISGGRNHTCGITVDQDLKCWGYNDRGQIGIGTASASTISPTIIDSGTKYIYVGVGHNTTCAITTANKLKCFGNNTNDILQIGAATSSPTPVLIDSTENYKQVSIAKTSGRSICAITTNNKLKCWGLNGNGQLGNGTTTNISAPTIINGTDNYDYVSNGNLFTCARLTSGTLQCFGQNSSGKLGIGSTDQQTTPQNVTGSY